jgi:tRNA 2-thiouridine synthesizing protein A
MNQTLDLRGLRCPVPLLRARAALPGLREGETLTVVATDPEAPIDLAALAADEGLTFTATESGGEWRLRLHRAPRAEGDGRGSRGG